MNYKIINVKKHKSGIEEAINYIHSKWGNNENYDFYFDCISHSSDQKGKLPRFYLMLKENEIVGCYGLLVNDIISRQDLLPWFACLFIEEKERGKRLSEKLLDHAKQEANALGYNTIYLQTEHENFYEKFNWIRIEDGYGVSGRRSKMYKIDI